MATKNRMTSGKELVSRPEFNSVSEPIKRALQEFVDNIPKINFLCPDGDPNPRWLLFERPTLNEAYDAAWSAIEGAPGTTQKLDAITWAAEEAVLGAFRGEPLAASVRNAVERVASTVQLGAAKSAGLYALYILSGDRYFPDKELLYYNVRERWKVWEKGYSLLAEVNGMLYVCAARPEATTGLLLRW